MGIIHQIDMFHHHNNTTLLSSPLPFRGSRGTGFAAVLHRVIHIPINTHVWICIYIKSIMASFLSNPCCLGKSFRVGMEWMDAQIDGSYSFNLSVTCNWYLQPHLLYNIFVNNICFPANHSSSPSSVGRVILCTHHTTLSPSNES